MIHYDTRCYCDKLCKRNSSDCCPDAVSMCGMTTIEQSTEITTSETTLIPNEILISSTDIIPESEEVKDIVNNKLCAYKGISYSHGESVEQNCNIW